MRIRYTREAIDDLVRLRAFIAEHNPTAAARIAADLIRRMNGLGANPRLGRPVAQAPDPDAVRDLVTPYHVVYLLQDDALHVLRIWHQRENRPPGQ
ncbi:type II toxin-antitoxin system RelE/ParE family toxin [Pseudothauera rhizosphaerae]|uniref:Type II toxin-antitoxin system RelE/ParE family toxin n=1 Tax=Pseudothauera rhizosphaerae TaxID=2565932 RepID=A0A4S4AEU3_9RHOO|nr:type II toxin-antitoxin system RelE/ParE family toxin [Pseudothauera rhizosphaerae]THF57669.1 type II toxin-antitoxin system RelE/ParE family toxin [Pseudothauera rhizosphaerae]